MPRGPTQPRSDANYVYATTSWDVEAVLENPVGLLLPALADLRGAAVRRGGSGADVTQRRTAIRCRQDDLIARVAKEVGVDGGRAQVQAGIAARRAAERGAGRVVIEIEPESRATVVERVEHAQHDLGILRTVRVLQHRIVLQVVRADITVEGDDVVRGRPSRTQVDREPGVAVDRIGEDQIAGSGGS